MKGLGNAEILGRNLRRYIDLSGKLDKEIAAEIGVSPSTFSEWTKGKKYPRIDKIEMLANYFGIQKSDLIEEQTETENAPPKTREARIISHGVDGMPPEERAKAVNLFKMMFEKYADKFEEGEDDDDEGQL